LLLDEWLNEFGLDKLVNKKGTTWRNLDEQYKTKADTPESAKALILEFPSLIKRPVVDFQGKLTIGQIDFSEPSL